VHSYIYISGVAICFGKQRLLRVLHRKLCYFFTS